MVFYHKSCHPYGLDTLLYRHSRDCCPSNVHYLYVFDNVYMEQDITPPEFYDYYNSNVNTWNYDLEFKNLNKDQVLINSIAFGFGDYSDDGTSDHIVVKPIHSVFPGRKYCPHKGEAHLVSRVEYDSNYNKARWMPQKVLSSNTDPREEMNVFILRDLKTRKLHTLCYNVKFPKTSHVNRKFTTCTFERVDNPLGSNFIDYCNHINIDYGRIELINDQTLGWCVIDVNNSPGGGPLTNTCVKEFSNILKSVLS